MNFVWSMLAEVARLRALQTDTQRDRCDRTDYHHATLMGGHNE